MDKLVVLAAGLGKRMQRPDDSARLDSRQAAAAQRGVKALIPIERPFLDYVLTCVADAGYRHVCLVIGPDHQQLRDYYTRLSGGRLLLDFAVQPEPLGTAHALRSAAPFAGDDPVAVINSDDYYPESALRALRKLEGQGLVAFTGESLVRHGNVDPARLGSYATVEMDPHGYLVRIVEKPGQAQDRPATLAGLAMGHPWWRGPARLVGPTATQQTLISMNCWRFEPAIFQACHRIDPSPRGEYEIPDAVTYSMKHLGQRYRVLRSDEPVLSLSYRSDIASVTQRLKNVEVRL